MWTLNLIIWRCMAHTFGSFMTYWLAWRTSSTAPSSVPTDGRDDLLLLADFRDLLLDALRWRTDAFWNRFKCSFDVSREETAFRSFAAIANQKHIKFTLWKSARQKKRATFSSQETSSMIPSSLKSSCSCIQSHLCYRSVPQTHTHTRMHAHKNARLHACTHTHIHTMKSPNTFF